MADKKYFETDEFKQQQKEWYEKIKQDGFKDLENENEKIKPEIFSAHRIFKINESDQQDNRYILNNFNFKKELHKKIFELYASGLSSRKIEKEINKQLSQSRIVRLINRIKTEAKK